MFCIKCGKQLNENDEFCPQCGAKVKKENVSSSSKLLLKSKKSKKNLNLSLSKILAHKFTLLIIITIFIFIIVIAFKTLNNKNNFSNNISGEITSSLGNSSTKSNNKNIFVGNSKVKVSSKDGRTYYTSSDGKWIVEKNNISFSVGSQQKSQRFSLQNATFGSVPAWQAKLAYDENITMYLNMTSEISQGSSYTLQDAKGIKDGYILHMYFEDKSKMDKSNSLMAFPYIVSTTIDSTNEKTYLRAYDSFEMKIDCYNSQEGIICGYLSFEAPYFDNSILKFHGYFALTPPNSNGTSNGNSTQIAPSQNLEIPKIDVKPLPQVDRKTPCVACHGSKMCSVCNGTGVHRMYGQSGICSACGGNKKCSICNGTGYN